MYNYIIGEIKDHYQNAVIVENNNIGYMVYTSNPFVFEKNKEYKVYIYQHINEKENTLYGFSSEDEKNLFLKLINVKGVGPRVALPIVGAEAVENIIGAIERENIVYLKKFPRVGEKLARQIILDLKGKLVEFGDVPKETKSSNELTDALKALGYKERELRKVLEKVDNTKTIEEQIKEALQLLLK